MLSQHMYVSYNMYVWVVCLVPPSPRLHTKEPIKKTYESREKNGGKNNNENEGKTKQKNKGKNKNKNKNRRKKREIKAEW